MANFLANNGRNIIFLSNLRRLSSFNNNRTKFGIVTVIKSEDITNIWSESHWSELAKQFNKSSEFPLPGQTGVAIKQQQQKETLGGKSTTNTQTISTLPQAQQPTKPSPSPTSQQHQHQQHAANLEHLFYKPLLHESQAIKMKEAAGGLFYKNKMDNCLFTATFSSVGDSSLFELKCYACPASLAKDFQNYFKSNLINESSVNLLTITFKTENDMSTWSSQVEDEREILTKKFVDTAQEICSLLERAGFWADYVDPSSGRPYKSPYTHATFYETDERYRQLGFEINDYGCCKVISHHTWGTKTYVGSLLTNAPHNSEFLVRLLKKYNI